MLKRLQGILHRPSADAERGSVAVSMAVMGILVTMSLAGVVRATSVLSAARTTQDFAANLSWAESAISDVQWRLDQSDPGDPATHVLTRTTSTYKYTATPSSLSTRPTPTTF